MCVQEEDKKDEGQEKEQKSASTTSTASSSVTRMEEDKKEEEKKAEEEKEKKEPEPTSELLTNPARVMKSQLRVLSPKEGSKYRPIKEVSSRILTTMSVSLFFFSFFFFLLFGFLWHVWGGLGGGFGFFGRLALICPPCHIVPICFSFPPSVLKIFCMHASSFFPFFFFSLF